MPQKSNRTSIIIAIVAVILILGGVFLLNQTISSRNNDDDKEAKISESSSTSTSSFSVSSSQESESSSSSLSEESSSSSKSESSDNSIDTNLEDGQIAVKVTSVGGTNPDGTTSYQMQVIDSTYPDSKFFNKGAVREKMTLRGVNFKEGESYKLNISFEETNSSFTINSISVAEEL